MAVDTTREEIVVAFRGSSTIRNWIADFDFVLVPYEYCDGCYVHDGFKESWDQIKTYALSYLESAFTTYPDYTLTVTGHSLGAAVGTIAATELRETGYEPPVLEHVVPERHANADFLPDMPVIFTPSDLPA